MASVISMNCGIPLPLASIEAVRPVFMIVMGVSLIIFAWRLSHATSGWTARFIISGALLLGFGYAFLMPMYEAGIIKPVSPRNAGSAADAAFAWNSVKLIVMNGGWLLFGLGVCLHAKVFSPAPPRRVVTATPPIASHESIA